MTLDSASLARLGLVYPDLKTRACRLYEDMKNLHGLEMRVTEGIRTFQQQEKLYAQGRTAPGPIVTHSRPGSSIHHYGAAVDSCFVGGDPFLAGSKQADFLWKEFGRLALAHGLVWGGDFHGLCDRPHVQITYGLNLADIQQLYFHGGNSAVWAKFDSIRGVEVGSQWRLLRIQNRVLDPQVPVLV